MYPKYDHLNLLIYALNKKSNAIHLFVSVAVQAAVTKVKVQKHQLSFCPASSEFSFYFHRVSQGACWEKSVIFVKYCLSMLSRAILRYDPVFVFLFLPFSAIEFLFK